MKFGYTIIYVPDVRTSLEFFKDAFGIQTRFSHESGDYGELDTGMTTLAFASHALGHQNLPVGYVAASDSPKPLGIEIALITENVKESHAKALKAGAKAIKDPEVKPWGQTVSYLQCQDGTLVELCSPRGQ